MRVKIKKMPKAAYGGQQADGALDVVPTAWGGADAKDSKAPNIKASKTLTSVPREEANLEAEGGETAFGPISGDTIPDHMVIKGPRHSSGGVPLNLPEDTFIFSDTKGMKITDPKVLRIFGKARKKGGYTPAELAKPYDIQKYKAILMDPDSDRKDRENAKLMIENYIMKLGALAIAQESKKGFPQGIPEMARPYMEANGITEEDLIPQEEEPQQQMPQEGMAEGGTPEYPHGGFHSPFETMMEKQKENDFTKLSTAESLLTGPQGQYTKDEVLSNPLTGAEPAARMDTEGKLYETEKQEATPGRTISFEQKINDAWDVDMNALADQGAFFAGVGTTFGNQLQNAKRMKSIFDKSMDPDARENVFSGLHYANTPGVIATSGVSPTTVQSYRSQYGGAIPMAAYGMQLGGYDMPFIMSSGGASKVRITALPKANKGITIEGATPVSTEEYNSSPWTEYTDPETGRKFKYNKETKRIIVDTNWRADVGKRKDPNVLDKVCASMQDPNSPYYGMTGKQALIASNMYTSGENHPNWSVSVAKLDKCAVQAEGEGEGKIYAEEDDPEQGCQCKILDAQGNWTGEYETYEGVINEETGELECPPCDYEEEIIQEGEEGALDPTRWSDRAIGNLIAQTRFRTDAARVDPSLINRQEYSPVLQRRYDQDIQSNLAGLRKSIDTGGGTAQQKLFQNLAALDQATTKVGQRQKATEDYNANALRAAAQIAANLQLGTDAKNQAYLDRARLYNVGAIDKETAARNAKIQAINLAKTDAQNEMLQKAVWNFQNPEYQIDYRTGLPYFNPDYREPDPTKGQKDIVETYKDIIGDLGAGNEQVAYNLAKQKVYGNQKSQFGGFVSGSDMYPFFNE